MNGYIQLELGGKKRGCKFGAATVFNVVELLGLSFENLKMPFEFKECCAIIYAGLVNDCNLNSKEQDFTQQDVVKWADDLSAVKLMEIYTLFMSKLSGESKPEPKKGKK